MFITCYMIKTFYIHNRKISRFIILKVSAINEATLNSYSFDAIVRDTYLLSHLCQVFAQGIASHFPYA